MKKSILVLSALLTLVVSGICLQSCSSEYDEYTTEEYGYYTEEEIDAIEALAEKYGLSIEVDENYYGSKESLYEIEEEMKGLSKLLGVHKIGSHCFSDDNTMCSLYAANEGIPRSATRYIEGSGEWEETEQKKGYYFQVKISWQEDISSLTGIKTTGTVDVAEDGCFIGANSNNLSTMEYATYMILFNGTARYRSSSKTYTFSIHSGEVDTRAKSGRFEVD